MRLAARLKTLETKRGVSNWGDLEYHTMGVASEASTTQVWACTLPDHEGRSCFVSIARGFGLPDGKNRIKEIIGQS